MRTLFTTIIFIMFINNGYSNISRDTISNNKQNVKTLIDSLINISQYNKKAKLSIRIAEELSDYDWTRCTKYISIAEENVIKSDIKPIDIFVRIANIYEDKDMLDLSLKYYLKAYKFYDKGLIYRDKAILENNIAIAYARLKKTHKALEFFNNTKKYYQSARDTLNTVKVYNNLGLLYMETRLDSSITFFNKALSLSKTINNNKLKTFIYTNLGRCYSYKKDKLKTNFWFNKALVEMYKIDNKKTKAWVFKSIAEDLYKRKLLDSAIVMANKGLGLLQREKYTFIYKDLSQILYKSFLENKNYKSASEYFIIYDKIRDSLNVEEKAVNATKIKLEQEYLLEKQKRKIKNKEEVLKYTILGFSLFLTLLILLMLLIVYRNKLHKEQLKNQLIEAKKDKLNKDLESKQRLLIAKAMKEIHKTEIIQSILEELKKIKIKAVKKETQQAINIIQNKLERDIDSNIWDEFELSFEQVNKNFYDNLNQLHPKLTARDRRLASLLILGLSSKEIAQITGQDFKSVENARTRLRKKLDITNKKISLVDYLTSLNN